MEIALGEAEVENALAGGSDEAGRFGSPPLTREGAMAYETDLAREHLRSALARATWINSRDLIDRVSSTIAILAAIEHEDEEQDAMTQVWANQQTGESERLADEREQIKQFGRMIRMVGLRVAEGWR